MPKRMMTATISAMTIVGTLTLHAQNPQTSNPQTAKPQTTNPQTANPQTANPQTSNPQTSNPQTSNPQTSSQQTAQTSGNPERMLTVTGCLQAEKDVPGRRE